MTKQTFSDSETSSNETTDWNSRDEGRAMKRQQHDAAFLITDDATGATVRIKRSRSERISRSLSRRKRSRGMFSNEEGRIDANKISIDKSKIRTNGSAEAERSRDALSLSRAKARSTGG